MTHEWSARNEPSYEPPVFAVLQTPAPPSPPTYSIAGAERPDALASPHDLYGHHAHIRDMAGIGVPILPGVQPLSEFATAKLLAASWAVRLPSAVAGRLADLEAADDADAAFEHGLDFVAGMCDGLLLASTRAGEGCGLHFFVYDAEHAAR